MFFVSYEQDLFLTPDRDACASEVYLSNFLNRSFAAGLNQLLILQLYDQVCFWLQAGGPWP